MLTRLSACLPGCLVPCSHVSVSAAPEDAAKSQLLSQMQDWLNEKVALADKVLVEHAVTKVYDGDVILTYAYSQVSRTCWLAAYIGSQPPSAACDTCSCPEFPEVWVSCTKATTPGISRCRTIGRLWRVPLLSAELPLSA